MTALDRLTQIIPQDQALANKALASSMQGITGINSMLLPTLAKTVGNIQTNFGLPLVNAQTSAVSPAAANAVTSSVGTGTGPHGTVTIMDGLGTAAGWISTRAMSNTVTLINSISTAYLQSGYSNMYNTVTGAYTVHVPVDPPPAPPDPPTYLGYQVVIPGGPGAGTYPAAPVPTAAAAINDAFASGLIPAVKSVISGFSGSNPTQYAALNSNWSNIVNQLNLEKSKAAHSAKLDSLGQISAGVAHEINNPLTIITGMSRMIKNSLDSPEKVTSSLLSINNSVERISKIVMGLQKFARINNQVKRELHQLNSIIKETDVITQIKSKHNMINFEVESSSTSFINCDSIEIEQVLINLTNNAMDAVKNQSERWVKVKVFDRDNHVVVHVTDSGSKITPEDALKLFDPFFTTKNVGEGTGLGLSIAQGIIKAHHGELSYLPDNPYTCFEFTLPIYN